MNTEQHPVSPEHPTSKWNLLSLAAFFAAPLLAFIWVQIAMAGISDPWGWGSAVQGLIVLALVWIIGFFMGLVSLIRQEQSPGLAILGLLLNGLPLLLPLLMFFSMAR